MRQKLNESQAAQVGLVAVLVVIALVFFLKSSGGEEESAESGAGPTVATVNGVPGSGDSPGEAVESAISNLEASGGSASATAAPTSLPAPPPPPALTAAYDAGDTVVLLVVDNGGIDDARTEAAAERLAGMPGVAYFEVPVRQLPRYAAVTVGVNVNRVPALVVMRPRGLSGGVPQASVDYGLQTPQTAVQAVHDASYKGPEATYQPD
ncbi:MAG: hypothetical protein AB7T48_10700 [Solirubrobacterales bacterium]